MALILLEEVVMGLDDVKESLAQAVTTLELLTEDLHPNFGTSLREVLHRDLVCPLRTHLAMLEQLEVELAAQI